MQFLARGRVILDDRIDGWHANFELDIHAGLHVFKANQ
jgi:hypothetical protein